MTGPDWLRPRRVQVSEVIADYRPGSYDTCPQTGGAWTWECEEAEIRGRQPGYLDALIDWVREHGTVPTGEGDGEGDWPDDHIILGNDGRVWGGHHRILAARAVGLDEIDAMVYDEASR